MESVTCNLCGRGQAESYCIRDGFSIVRCPCGLVYTNPRLDQAERDALYSPAYFTDASGGAGYDGYDATGDVRRRTFARWLDRIGGHAPKPGKLLDVGCASGFLLEAARERGWEAAGLEPSVQAAAKARAKGFRVIETPLDRTDWAGERFDLVTMFDVLEHLPDPSADIGFIRRELLLPGGLLALVTPNIASLHARLAGGRWFLLKPREHLWYFDPRTARRLLEGAGLTVLDMGSSGQYMKLGDVTSRLKRYSAALGAAADAALGGLGLKDTALYVDASSLWVLARAG